MALLTEPFRAKVRRRSAVSVTSLSLAATTRYDCFSCAGARNAEPADPLALCSTPGSPSSVSPLINAASFRLISPSFWTFIFRVAEHRTVVLLVGSPRFKSDFWPWSRVVMILVMSCSNPRSMSRSPSSRTSHLMLRTSRTSVLSRWSTSRPGVATKIFTPFRSRAFSDFFFSPPMTVPATI